MKNTLFAAILLIFAFAQFAVAADYQCVFNNSIAHINCNLVGAAASFCTLAGPGPVANNPPQPSCTAQTITCTLRNFNGSENSIRCSNTPSLISGPTKIVAGNGGSPIGGASGCPYNDCALNQMSCASGYAYQKCVPDPLSPECNKWDAKNCVANAPCQSGTSGQLATCAGIIPSKVQESNGLFFYVDAGQPGAPPDNSNPPPANPIGGGIASKIFNGKTYYVVSADDPTGNTGNEACTKAGKACVGYTAYSTEVCKYFHPTASVTTTVNGSKTGFYCNGPPQTGLACESAFDNCQICPQCNVNANCGTDIGGLFREMYVECADSVVGPNSEPAQVVSIKFNFFGDGRFNISDESSNPPKKYGMVVQNSQIVETKQGEISNPTANIKVSKAGVDAISKAQDPVKEFKNQLNNGGIVYSPVGIIEQIKFFFFRLFLNFR